MTAVLRRKIRTERIPQREEARVHLRRRAASQGAEIGVLRPEGKVRVRFREVLGYSEGVADLGSGRKNLGGGDEDGEEGGVVCEGAGLGWMGLVGFVCRLGMDSYLPLRWRRWMRRGGFGSS